MKRREFLKCGAIFAAAICAPLALPRSDTLPPPSAGELFPELCTSCGACIDACPTGGLRPVSILSDPLMSGKPELAGFCCVYVELTDPDPRVAEKIKRGEITPTPCRACSEACPTGALSGGIRKIGVAEIDRTICLGWQRETCDRCAIICPLNAVILRGRKPHVVFERCVGCRLCEHVCPTEPKAVRVRRI